MKKQISLWMCALLATASLWAQDIIVTNDAKKIEVKILEVSKNEIKYKEMDNLNGPTFILDTKEISSIIYSNGKVVLYNQDFKNIDSASNVKEEKPLPISEQMVDPISKTTQTTNENTIEILLLSGNTIVAQLVEMKTNYVAYILNGKSEVIPASQIEKVTLLANGQVKEYNRHGTIVGEETQTTSRRNTTTDVTNVSKSGRIYRDNGHYMHNDTYISSKEVVRILQKENESAFKQWQIADRMAISGGVMSGVGLGLALGSISPFIHATKSTSVPAIYRWSVAAIGLVSAGGLSACIGVGLIIGANARYNKAIDIYNSKYDHAAAQLQWHVAPNEVGLALVF